MPTDWERYLKRWSDAGLIQPVAAERIRVYEAEQAPVQGLHWSVLFAIGLGGFFLGAGVLLFVAAHWDTLSPTSRFGLVLLLVASFHVAGALAAERFAVLSHTLHAVGTLSLGAGIFLAGQIFHLQEHWPSGILLWALGAWSAWALLQDTQQATFVALLTPLWLGSEWREATRGLGNHDAILATGGLLLAITYLTPLLPGRDTPTRHALAWIGNLALLPATFAVIATDTSSSGSSSALLDRILVVGWLGALGLPLALAWWSRGTASSCHGVGRIVGCDRPPRFVTNATALPSSWQELSLYGLGALGAIGLIAWGLHEARKERINLGVAGFALSVLFFYFSTVMGKLGRSASLIGLGVLFLLGGWLLERTRRHLVARLERHERQAEEEASTP